jgi:hypothetical protein
MSDAKKKSVRNRRLSAVPDPSAGPTPTVTHYEELSTAVGDGVKKAFALLDNFEAPHPSTVKFVRGLQNVPVAFIRTTVSAVVETPELQDAQRMDVSEARDALQYGDAFMPLVDLVDGFSRALKFTIDARRAKVAADALQIYDIAKGFARDPGSAHVASHVENMKRDLGRGRPRTRITAPQETVAKADTTP